MMCEPESGRRLVDSVTPWPDADPNLRVSASSPLRSRDPRLRRCHLRCSDYTGEEGGFLQNTWAGGGRVLNSP
jgi:hypothetical protein